MVFCKCAYPIDDKTVKTLWHQSPVPTQQQLELWDYHTHPDRYEARLQVVKLDYGPACAFEQKGTVWRGKVR